MGRFERGAGILLHITSLPSKYGIGDLGKEAFAFVDFLSDRHQKYWQILPLSIIEEGQFYSPYSSPSAFAGNWFIISPDKLLETGLIRKSDIQGIPLCKPGKVQYNTVFISKSQLLDKAFTNFTQIPPEDPLKQAYKSFDAQQSYWLDTFALFISLKQMFVGKSWHQWPLELKHKDSYALEKYQLKLEMEIYFQKFVQFIFHQQWFALKKYCNTHNIIIIGDLPIYVNFDSVDVWWNPEIFKLNNELEMLKVAGVPPDYFSETGQLWGMPVYNWNYLKKTGYAWWHQRFGRNLELYDIVRLDHFRGFSSYWEIPAEEKTAIHGSWQPGPGHTLFDSLKSAFHHLPVIAEDLGEIDEAVHHLRDQYHFPGMKVFQFGFEEDMATSMHAPHNYPQNAVVYSGTHDNNTLRGWYREKGDTKKKKRLRQYLNGWVWCKNIHKKVIHILYRSTADMVIIPMQDVLGLGRKAMMNKPSTIGKNWQWQLRKNPKKKDYARYLKKLVLMFNR